MGSGSPKSLSPISGEEQAWSQRLTGETHTRTGGLRQKPDKEEGLLGLTETAAATPEPTNNPMALPQWAVTMERAE